MFKKQQIAAIKLSREIFYKYLLNYILSWLLAAAMACSHQITSFLRPVTSSRGKLGHLHDLTHFFFCYLAMPDVF